MSSEQQPLTATEIRKGMTECIRELQERMAACKGEVASDERLANLISSYIDEEVSNHVKKIADTIEDTVMDCVEEKLAKGGFQEVFISAMADVAPTVAKHAAVAAVKSVPLSMVMRDSDAEHSIAKMTIGQALVGMCKEHLELQSQMSKVHEYVHATRMLLGELLHVVSNDGGEVKVFTAGEAPGAFFQRRPDIEAASMMADCAMGDADDGPNEEVVAHYEEKEKSLPPQPAGMGCVRQKAAKSAKKAAKAARKAAESEFVVTRDVIVTQSGAVYKRQEVNDKSVAAAIAEAVKEQGESSTLI